MKKFMTVFGVFVPVSLSTWILIQFWPYIFSKTVVGMISDVQRVGPPSVVIGGGSTPATSTELFSFAVAIKQKDGEIATASSEDRQWAVAQPGQCVEAKFYPYPPWDLKKSGTYYGARLIKLFVCESGSLVPAQ